MRSKRKKNASLSLTWTLDTKKLEKKLIHDAKALQMPSGAAETLAREIVQKLQGWTQSRTHATEAEVECYLMSELGKYNPDLAYVYDNRGKII